MEDVAVDNEQIGSLAWLDGPNLALEAQQLCIRPGCGSNRRKGPEDSGLNLDFLTLEAPKGAE